MKTIVKYSAIAVILLSSCDKSDILQNSDEIPIIVNAELPLDGNISKTYFNGLDVIWRQNDKIGLFTNSNSNKLFTSKNEGKKASFEGTVDEFANSSFLFFSYPQKDGLLLDQNNYLELITSSNVFQPSNSNYDHLDTLLKMVGRSTTKYNSSNLSSGAFDQNTGGVIFHFLSAKIDFIIKNNTGSSLKINKVTYIKTDNQPVFSTVAKVRMDYNSASLTNYPDNSGDFIISSPSNSSISVANLSPASISSGDSLILSTMILPTSIAGGSTFYLDVETDIGNFRETKTIRAGDPFVFSRGYRYKTRTTLNPTTETNATNSYPGTSYPLVTLNLGGSIGAKTFAPVNVGYIAVTNPYGLLFQWHRKYGQGRTGLTLQTGGQIPIADGSLYSNKDKFYTTSGGTKNWTNSDDATWSMSEQYNPCPAGWRVPTKEEMDAILTLGYTRVNAPYGLDGAKGLWIGGNHSTDHVGSIFLPETDARQNDGSLTTNSSVYWTATKAIANLAYGLEITSRNQLQKNKVNGNQIRCIK